MKVPTPNIQVACGAHHTAFVTNRGSLHTFGRGARGQLGVGSCDDVLQPILVKDFTSASRIVTQVRSEVFFFFFFSFL